MARDESVAVSVVALREAYAASERRLAAAERQLIRLSRGGGRRGTRSRRLGAITVSLLIALIPLGLLAANPFNDLNPGSPHNGNIDAIYNAGITTGCDPGVAYCPNGTVTREEMASFLARTAGLGGNPPVANAATAVNATNAANANTLGGYAPSGLTRFATANQVDVNGGASIPLPASTSAFATALSVNISVPRRSIVRISTSGWFTATSTSGCPCQAQAAVSYIPANAVQVVSELNIATAPTDIVDGGDRRPYAGAISYPLDPGSYTVALVVIKPFGSGAVSLNGATLHVELFPFDGAGNQP